MAKDLVDLQSVSERLKIAMKLYERNKMRKRRQELEAAQAASVVDFGAIPEVMEVPPAEADPLAMYTEE